MQSTVDLLAVEHEAAGDPSRLVDVRAEVERRFPAREQRRAQRLEGHVERHVVVVAAEAVHATELVALEEHAFGQVVRVEQVGRCGQRLVPAPAVDGQLPRHDRGVVDDEQPAELDAEVGAERGVEVAEQVALGDRPREPDRLGPPRVVRLGRMELVVGRDEAPLVGQFSGRCLGRCVGHEVSPASWSTGVTWRSASTPIADRMSAVSRAAWSRQ